MSGVKKVYYTPRQLLMIEWAGIDVRMTNASGIKLSDEFIRDKVAERFLGWVNLKPKWLVRIKETYRGITSKQVIAERVSEFLYTLRNFSKLASRLDEFEKKHQNLRGDVAVLSSNFKYPSRMAVEGIRDAITELERYEAQQKIDAAKRQEALEKSNAELRTHGTTKDSKLSKSPAPDRNLVTPIVQSKKVLGEKDPTTGIISSGITIKTPNIEKATRDKPYKSPFS